MKKILFLFLVLYFSVQIVSANPYYSKDIRTSGMGVLEFTEDVDVFEAPDVKSEKLITLSMKSFVKNVTFLNAPKEAHEYFLARTNDNKKAFLAVTDELENGWYEVCYSQDENLYGWVQANEGRFLPWRKFQMYWGRKNSVYFFKDVTPEERKLYAKPFDKPEDKKLIGEFAYAHKIQPIIIKGNWMLIKVTDENRNDKIGYVRWRQTDGRILLFPHF